MTPPSGLMATQTLPRRIDLSWIDNTTNEVGFKIERKDGANGVFRIIAYTPANATAYTDANVIAGVSYSYRISAYNTSSTSLPSNTVSIVAR
jgi:fibronectin type 3 domain-containing protein